MTSPIHPRVLNKNDVFDLVDADTLSDGDVHNLIHTCLQLLSDVAKLQHNADHVAAALLGATKWNNGQANHAIDTCPLDPSGARSH